MAGGQPLGPEHQLEAVRDQAVVLDDGHTHRCPPTAAPLQRSMSDESFSSSAALSNARARPARQLREALAGLPFVGFDCTRWRREPGARKKTKLVCLARLFGFSSAECAMSYNLKN